MSTCPLLFCPLTSFHGPKNFCNFYAVALELYSESILLILLFLALQICVNFSMHLEAVFLPIFRHSRLLKLRFTWNEPWCHCFAKLLVRHSFCKIDVKLVLVPLYLVLLDHWIFVQHGGVRANILELLYIRWMQPMHNPYQHWWKEMFTKRFG